MSDENKEQPSSPVTVTFQNKTVIKSVVDYVLKKKPANWSRRSYASYYKKVYADWLLRDIDDMIESRATIVYRYDMFPSVSHNSLYARINQALAYILDNMDSDGKYKKFREELKIRRKSGVGVMLEFDSVLEGNHPRAEKVVDNIEVPKWKQKLYDYLDNSTVEEPLHIQNILLTPEQIEQLELELSGLSNVMAVITSREIKIVKG